MTALFTLSGVVNTLLNTLAAAAAAAAAAALQVRLGVIV